MQLVTDKDLMESVFALSEPKWSLYESTLTIQMEQRFAGNSPCNLHAPPASRRQQEIAFYIQKAFFSEGHLQSNQVYRLTSASTISSVWQINEHYREVQGFMILYVFVSKQKEVQTDLTSLFWHLNVRHEVHFKEWSYSK